MPKILSHTTTAKQSGFGRWKLDFHQQDDTASQHDNTILQGSRLVTQRACNRCRAKKLKCTGQKTGCDRCRKAQSAESCQYTDPSPRSPSQPSSRYPPPIDGPTVASTVSSPLYSADSPSLQGPNSGLHYSNAAATSYCEPLYHDDLLVQQSNLTPTELPPDWDLLFQNNNNQQHPGQAIERWMFGANPCHFEAQTLSNGYSTDTLLQFPRTPPSQQGSPSIACTASLGANTEPPPPPPHEPPISTNFSVGRMSSVPGTDPSPLTSTTTRDSFASAGDGHGSPKGLSRTRRTREDADCPRECTRELMSQLFKEGCISRNECNSSNGTMDFILGVSREIHDIMFQACACICCSRKEEVNLLVVMLGLRLVGLLTKLSAMLRNPSQLPQGSSHLGRYAIRTDGELITAIGAAALVLARETKSLAETARYSISSAHVDSYLLLIDRFDTIQEELVTVITG